MGRISPQLDTETLQARGEFPRLAAGTARGKEGGKSDFLLSVRRKSPVGLGRGLCALPEPGDTAILPPARTRRALCLQSLHPGMGSSPKTSGSGARSFPEFFSPRAPLRSLLAGQCVQGRLGALWKAQPEFRGCFSSIPEAHRGSFEPRVSVLNRSPLTDKSRDAPGAAPGAAAAGNRWCPACPGQQKGAGSRRGASSWASLGTPCPL